MRRDVFQAIADPNRRLILDLVAKEDLNLNALAEQFTISRPAISKHVKILSECGLLKIKQVGRERICIANLNGLSTASKWLSSHVNKPLAVKKVTATTAAPLPKDKKKSKKQKKDKKKKKK